MEEHKFNWKRFGIMVAIVILTAGAVGGATWFFMDQYAQEQQDELQAQIDELRSQVNEEATEVTEGENNEVASLPTFAANWYEYESTDSNYTFRYPKTVTASSPTSDTTCGYPLYVVKEKDSDNSSVGENYIMGNFFVINVRDSSSTAQEIVNSEDPNGVNTVTTIKGTGADSALLITKPSNYDGYPPLAYTSAIFTKNGKAYFVNGFQDLPNYGKECVPGSFEIINSIIETFRFN